MDKLEEAGDLVLIGLALLALSLRGLDPGSAWRGFLPRHAHFRFEPGQGSVPADYMRRESGIRFADHWFRFTDAGRYFHVQVYIGDSLPDGVEDEPYRILDTLAAIPAQSLTGRPPGRKVGRLGSACARELA
jgi:hypothetical protein